MKLYDSKYLSVTSIVGLRAPFDDKAFKGWCSKNGKDASLITSTSRVLGEKVSRWLEDSSYGLGDLLEPPIDELEERLKEGVEKFLNDWDIKEAEQEVVCKELNYAGRYDGIIADKKGESLLVDFKTFGAWKDAPYKRDAKKIKHTRWQVSLYAHALGWEDQLGVVIFKNNGDYEIQNLPIDMEMIGWVEKNQPLILKTIEEARK